MFGRESENGALERKCDLIATVNEVGTLQTRHLDGGFVERDFATASADGYEAQCLVGGYAKQPWPQTVGISDGTDVATCPDEGLLGGIASIFVVHDETTDMPIDRLLVFIQKQTKATVGIVARGAQYVFVGNHS